MFEQSNNNISNEIQHNQQQDNYGNNFNPNDQFQTKLLELQQIQIVKIKSLEKRLAEKEDLLQFHEQKQYQLEKDFEFNLQVIEERDSDIEELTQKMMHLKQIVEEKNQFINSLQSEIENFKFNQHQSMQNIQDQQEKYYEKIEQFKFENKTFQAKLGEKIEENEKLKQLLEESKRNIESKIKEAINVANKTSQEKLELLQIQIQQLKKENEDVLKQQQEARKSHEYNTQKQSDRLLLENENLLRMLNDEKLKNIESSKKLNEEISNVKQRSLDYQITISTQQKEIEGLKAAQNNWNVLFKEKMEIVNNEKEKLAEKILTKKHKNDQKLKEVKENMERKVQILQEDHNSQIRQYEQILRELRIENEKLNLQSNNLQVVVQEKERKYQKDIEELEDKFRSFRKNQEHTFKQQINDKNITDFHLKNKSEENQKIQKENAELKLKIEQIQKQVKDLENENELLIQEIVKYRKTFQQQQQQASNPINQGENNQANLDSQRQKRQQQQMQKGRRKINLNNSMQFEEDYMEAQNNQKNTIQNESNILQNQLEDESIEKIFTGDEGPVSPMRSKNFNLDFLSNNKSASLLVNSILLKNKLNPYNPNPIYQQNNVSQQRRSNQLVGNNSKLLEKIASQESEIEAYRHLIETLALEMENANKESQRIKNENADLKQRIGELQMDIMNYREKLLKSDLIQRSAFEKDQEIEEKDKELQNIQKRVQKHKNEIERLKKEREQLISISSDLREKLREQEDILELKDQMISEYKDNYIFINKFDMRKPTQLHLSQLELATEQGSKSIGNNNEGYNYNPIQEVDEKDQSNHNNRKMSQNSNNNSQSPNRNLKNKNNGSSQNIKQNNQRSNSKSNKKNPSIDKQVQKKDLTNQKGFKKNLPKYDQFQDIDEFINKNTAIKSQRVNNFFNSVEDNDDNQYYYEDNKQLFVQSNSKPILDRQDHDKQIYVPNSQKATLSQLEKLENEKRIQENKRNQLSANNSQMHTYNSQIPEISTQQNKLKVRNYSIKDEDLN